jgi:hypothetical protein
VLRTLDDLSEKRASTLPQRNFRGTTVVVPASRWSTKAIEHLRRIPVSVCPAGADGTCGSLLAGVAHLSQ